jgi:hypothetical protein
MTKAAIYASVSKQEQSNDMQLRDLREFAQRMGYETVEYVETESSVKTPAGLQADDGRRTLAAIRCSLGLEDRSSRLEELGKRGLLVKGDGRNFARKETVAHEGQIRV